MNREELLHKWLNDELSAEQTKVLLEDNRYASFLDIASYAQELKTPDFNSEEIYKNIVASKTQSNSKVRTLNPLKAFVRVAAVVALIVTVYLFTNSLDTQVNASYGEQIAYQLPDQSEVILNAGSEISFNKNDWEDSREISLEGEAYFKVAKGSTFTVNTTQGKVTVLGTQFNVFSRGQDFSVSCFEGRVSVSLKGEVITLTKGMNVSLEDRALKAGETLIAADPMWLHKESSFTNVSLAKVLSELERQYNITIDASGVDTQKRYSGSFTHDSLSIALQSICNPLQITYEVLNNDQVVLHESQ